VYEAEKMAARGGVFHQGCFNCKLCRKTLDYTTSVEFQVRLTPLIDLSTLE
jgi:LIM domain